MDDHHFGYNTKLKKNHLYYEEHQNHTDYGVEATQLAPTLLSQSAG
jgi:hypothetical protein